MATVSSRTPGISPALKSDADRRLSSVKNLNGSSQTLYEFISSPQQHRKSVFPLVVKSMKIVEQSKKPASFSNRPIFQTCFMSTSKFRVKIVGASDIRAMSPVPEIGVAVFILKDNKILFGRRRSLAIAANTYGLPGGHLEFGESFEECATREVKEETGLDIKSIELLTTTNDLFYDAVHLNVIYMRAYLSDPEQTPQNIEPDKCEGWDWYDLNNLPEPMFGPLREKLQGGLNPFPIAS